jgi:uncharacterized protein with beta-barrel porin domain
MAQLKVNVITNRSDNGSPELTQGATIPSGKTISGSGNINVNGTLTATSFVGNGSALGQFASAPKAYGIKLILDPIPFRS